MKEDMHELRAIRDHMPPRNVAKKGRKLLTCAKVLKRTKCSSIINLIVVIEATKAQLPK
jgi:hypothetical protein